MASYPVSAYIWCTSNVLFPPRSIAWGDFLKMGLERGERKYEEVGSTAQLIKVMEEYLDEYNLSATNPLNLGK